MTTIEHPEAARNAKEPPRDPAVVSIWLAATALAALFALTPLAGVIMGVPVAAASAITGVVVATKVLRRNQRPLIAAIGLLANLIVVAVGPSAVRCRAPRWYRRFGSSPPLGVEG